MKRLLLLTIIILKHFSILSQNTSRQFEIEPFLRWDKYPAFTNSINSISKYRLVIEGTSWGFNTAYKIPLRNKLLLKAGLGYFRYSFTDIVSTHQTFGVGDRRVINYPAQLDMVLGTDSYWYNTLSVSLGLEKNFEINKDFLVSGGFVLRNYLTFTQRYHLPYGNSFLPQPDRIKTNYKTFNKEYFGLGAEINIGILKKMGNMNIGPSLIVPLCDLWSQDSIFPTEDNSQWRNKWFRGIGTSIKIIYTIK